MIHYNELFEKSKELARESINTGVHIKRRLNMHKI